MRFQQIGPVVAIVASMCVTQALRAQPEVGFDLAYHRSRTWTDAIVLILACLPLVVFWFLVGLRVRFELRNMARWRIRYALPTLMTALLPILFVLESAASESLVGIFVLANLVAVPAFVVVGYSTSFLPEQMRIIALAAAWWLSWFGAIRVLEHKLQRRPPLSIRPTAGKPYPG